MNLLAKLVRARLPQDSPLGMNLRRVYWRFRRSQVHRLMHVEVLNGLAKSKLDIRFIQIGSNDASYGDPLRYHILNSEWRGIMVEPLPHIFARLEKRYANIPGLILENVAIAKRSGFQTFYYLREDTDPSLPPWYDQLGSFLKEVILRHDNLIPDLADRLLEKEIPCVTLDLLCQRHGYNEIDLIQIDTEGYDYEILKAFDLKRYTPVAVMFEHKHLSEADYTAALNLLHGVGYVTNSDSRDTLGVRVSALKNKKALEKAWETVRSRMGVPSYAKHAYCGGQ